MAAQDKENQTKAPTPEEISTEDAANELRLPVWSVISFDKRQAGGLTYTEAEQKLSELEAQKYSGLCIVTDEAAARMPEKN